MKNLSAVFVIPIVSRPIKLASVKLKPEHRVAEALCGLLACDCWVAHHIAPCNL